MFYTFFSAVLLFVISLNLAALLLCIFLRMWVFLVAKRSQNILPTQTSKLNSEDFFVSIHIPIYSEPPEIVIRSLKSLIELTFTNYEVIVYDNNTKEEKLWKPIEQFCKQYQQLRFFHKMNVKGFKAGALNLAYEEINPQTTHIMVIDADYCLNQETLNKVLPYFKDSNVGLVQLPQAYYNANKTNTALQSEYQHFFDVYMQAANSLKAVLCTGTMSVFSRECLEDVGLWSSSSITEDVEMGIKIHQKNFKSIFINESLGKGLMPTNFAELKKQRKRWVYGNMQTLSSFLLKSHHFTFKQLVGILSILTAWFSFLLVPMIGLSVGSITYFFAEPEWSSWLIYGSLISIVIELMFKLIFIVNSCSQDCKLKERLQCLGVHYGLMWECSLAWWLCLFKTPLGFERTNKFFGKVSHYKHFSPFLFIVILLANTFLLSAVDMYLTALIILLAIVPFLSVFYLFHSLTHTEKYTLSLSHTENTFL